MSPIGAKKTDIIWTWVGRAILTLLLAISGYGVSSWSDVRQRIESNADRIAIIEVTRFTGEMGRQMEVRIMTAIAATHPPEWLRLAVARMEKNLDVTADKIDSMRERLTRVEEKLNRDK